MKEILQIGLLDDEEKPRDLLATFVGGIAGYNTAFSTDDPYFALKEALGQRIDILITDIAMPDMTGLQLSKDIKNLDIPVVLYSVHEKLAVDGYGINTVYFLRKPPKLEEVANALDNARIFITRLQERTVPPLEDFVMLNLLKYSRYFMLAPSEVDYLEQNNIDTKLTLDSGEEIELRSSLKNTLNQINRSFIVRVHRSYALNYYKIKAMDQAYCYMRSGKQIPIGNEYRKGFMEFLRSRRH
ncbi:LytTR family DNA-binding domain-containing protein [Algoriphagus sp. NG3]|uniref:LytR/AlgR family response regulator transcription factor n=1 Tax=Algoriphagus sp. NG3 TaxID=3097546 RepID=UPI002A80F33B|nr:LytTR family DNA-binding domain-containing protein [Algoriphagus sp. NG3]WPR73737.1 LytTR family DNA-binding domain-containing protein [Algoriphagus sp. NG3]